MSISGKERGLTPGEFGIRVENNDLFFKALKRGFAGEVGRQLLEKPVKEVVISLVSGRRQFNLFAAVFINEEASQKNSMKESVISHEVAKSFAKNNPNSGVIERGGNFIVTASGGTRLLVAKDEGFNDEEFDGKMHRVISITTGMEPYRAVGSYLQVVPAPLSEKGVYEKVMPDFIEVIMATVDQISKTDKKIAFNDELIIKTPETKKSSDPESEETEDKVADVVTKVVMEKPNVKFDEIGGQEKAKREIQEIAFALTNPEIYRKWGTRPPKGVLVHGPPGTGKTLLARALASEAKAKFFNVKSTDFGSKWINESSRMIQEIFNAAYGDKGRTIIFFDEIDTIASKRETSHDEDQKVLGVILTNMDGIEKHDNVMVVGSTNRLDSLDTGLTRAGRFDRLIELAPPNAEEKKQIFEIHMKKAQSKTAFNLFSDIDINVFAGQRKITNGADIEEIVRRVLIGKLRQERNGEKVGPVTTEDFLKEIREYERGKDNKKPIGFSRQS